MQDSLCLAKDLKNPEMDSAKMGGFAGNSVKVMPNPRVYWRIDINTDQLRS
jgi:hypothetical protein